MIEKDDPRIREWKNGIPFDENGEIIRGVRLDEDEMAKLIEEFRHLYPDPTNNPTVRAWRRYLST